MLLGLLRIRQDLAPLSLGALHTHVLLNTFQAKHAWILLAFLLAWAAEQVAWVSTGGDEREACYGVFDAKGPRSVASAVVAALVVVGLLFGED